MSKWPRDMTSYAIPAVGRSGGILAFLEVFNGMVDVVPVGA